MNSCFYICKLSHERLFPKSNSFKYSIYMLYLDLDELEHLERNHYLFSYNKFNVFSFFDKDHFKFLTSKSEVEQLIARENIDYDLEKYKNKNTKERIKLLAEELHLGLNIEKVYVLTNLRNFGYIFNPVSFYYCFDKKGKLLVMFSEVNNTFGDQKMYYTLTNDSEAKIYKSSQQKNYYISPFISYDNYLQWQFSVPGEAVMMAIDSLKNQEVELKTLLVGQRKPISNSSFLWIQLRYPMITLVIIVLIHYQAARLFLKKLPFFRKEETDKKISDLIKSISK